MRALTVFLMEMDAKLDEVLMLLREDDDADGELDA